MKQRLFVFCARWKHVDFRQKFDEISFLEKWILQFSLCMFKKLGAIQLACWYCWLQCVCSSMLALWMDSLGFYDAMGIENYFLCSYICSQVDIDMDAKMDVVSCSALVRPVRDIRLSNCAGVLPLCAPAVRHRYRRALCSLTREASQFNNSNPCVTIPWTPGSEDRWALVMRPITGRNSTIFLPANFVSPLNFIKNNQISLRKNSISKRKEKNKIKS